MRPYRRVVASADALTHLRVRSRICSVAFWWYFKRDPTVEEGTGA
jgi:hypothetical protein